MKLSSFDQAKKNIEEVILDNPNVPELSYKVLIRLLGKLNLMSKLSKKERKEDDYVFELERTIEKITELMNSSEELKHVWEENQLALISPLLK